MQLHYLPLTPREVQLALRQRWPDSGDGPPPAVPPPSLPPLVQRMLRSGLLVVAVRRAEGVPAGGLFKPYFKALVEVGGLGRAETDAAQANRQGTVEFARPCALHLPQEAAQDATAQGALQPACGPQIYTVLCVGGSINQCGHWINGVYRPPLVLTCCRVARHAQSGAHCPARLRLLACSEG